MIAAQIDATGLVTNTIVVDSLNVIPGLIDGTGAAIGDTWDGEEFVRPPVVVLPPTVPQDISPRQIRLALTRAGLREAVETAVAAGDQDLKDWYEFSTAFERDNAQVEAMRLALGVDSASLDDLWTLGVTL